MKAVAEIAVILGSVAMLLGVMHLVRLAARRWDWPAEVQRKAVHIATGAYALMLPVLFDRPWPVLLLVGVTVAVMLWLRSTTASGGVGGVLHGVGRKSYGDMLFAIAVGFLFFRSAGNPVLFALPVAVLTISDAAAALAGSAYGRRIFTVEAGTKSYEGVAIFFLVTCIIAMIMLLLMTDIPRANVVTLAVTVAAFGALVEADSWRGFDNLFLPVGLHLFLAAHLATPPLGLAALALGFAVIVAFMLRFARPLGLTPHSARTHAVALFLICSVTAPVNAVLPALAVLAHVWARSEAPSRSPYPDLDAIAAVIVVSLLWLFAGEWFGRTAIDFYSMTFAGITAAFAFIALEAALGKGLAGLGAIAVGAVLALVYRGVLAAGAPEAGWHGPLMMPLLATLAVVAAATLGWPQIFRRYRSPRVALLAGAVPAASYLSNVL